MGSAASNDGCGRLDAEKQRHVVGTNGVTHVVDAAAGRRLWYGARTVEYRCVVDGSYGPFDVLVGGQKVVTAEGTRLSSHPSDPARLIQPGRRPALSRSAMIGVVQQHAPGRAPAGRCAMTVRGYVLIEAEVGKAKAVGEAVQEMAHHDARVVAVDTVTGPFDVIVRLEAEDLDKLGNAITDGIQRVEGVQRTTTCLAVKLG